MPTPRRPKGMPVAVSPTSPYPELDDWLSVTPKEREWVAEDLQYGKLPGDDERKTELMAAPGSEVETIKTDRAGFLERNPNYTYENKKASKTDLYLKPIGQGIVDTAKDMGRIGADLLFRGKVPTMGEVFGARKAPSSPPSASAAQPEAVTPALPDLTPPPQSAPAATIPKPSVGTAPSGAPVNAPANPRKPAISTTPARVMEVPDLVPSATGKPQFGATSRKRTLLNPDEEDHFQSWYRKTAKELGINANPDDPGHKYDYRAFWRSGGNVAPDPTDLDDAGKPRMHFSSKFKDDDHPNRFVMQDGKVLDSKTDQLIPSSQFMAIATKQQKANLERHMVEAGFDFKGMAQPALPDLSRSMPGGADIADMRDQMQARQLMEQQQGTAPNPTASMIQQKPLSYGEAYAQAGKSFARSAGTTSGAVLKGIGRWAKEIDDHMGGEKKPLNDYATYKLGQNISNWSKEVFRGRPDLQKNFLLTTLFEAGGSSVPFLAAGAGAAALGAGPGTTAALTGALASSDSMVEQAPAAATDDQKRLGLMLGAGLGLTEGIPISDLFRRIDLASGGTLRSAVKVGSIQAIEESVQEWFQQVGENAVKKYIYGMLGQDLQEGAAEGATAGGMVGFLTGFMLSGKGRMRAAAEVGKEDDKPKEQPTPQPATPPSGPASSTLPDLGAVPPKVKEQRKSAKVGDAVNRSVQDIASKVEMPTLETQKAGEPKLIKKGKTQEVAIEGTYGKEVIDVTPLDTPKAEEKPTPPPALTPDPLDDEMREAMDQDLDFLEEDPGQKPASKEVDKIDQKVDDEAPTVAPATAIKADEIGDMLGGMGKGIADGMYESMFDKVAKGETKEAGQESVYLQAAKPVYEAGGIEDADDMKAFSKEISDINDSGVTGDERNKAIRKVMAEWMPNEKPKDEESAAPTPSLEPAIVKQKEVVQEAKETLADLEDPTSAIDNEEIAAQRQKVDQAEATLASLEAPSQPVEKAEVTEEKAADNQLPTDATADTNERAVPTLEAVKPASQDFDQSAYKKKKAALTKAEKSQDPQKILEVAQAHLDEWEKTGQYPDDWSRWERAKEDAELAIRRQKAVSPLEQLETSMIPGLDAPRERLKPYAPDTKKTTPGLSFIESPDLRARRKLGELKDEFDAAGKMEVTDETRPQLQALIDRTASWPHAPGSNLALQLERERNALRKRLETTAVPSLEAPAPAKPTDQPAIPALDSPKSSAPIAVPNPNYQDLRASVVDAEKAFKAATTPAEREKYRDRVAQLHKEFKANPGKINRAEYDTRNKMFGNALSKMNQEVDRDEDTTKKDGRFADRGDGLNEAAMELRESAHDKKADGDVLLDNSKYVPFDQAVRIAREGIESGQVKPAPFQLNNLLGISMADADRVLKATSAATSTTPSLSPPQRGELTTEKDGIIPSLEGANDERPNEPGVADSRPPQGEPTQAVPSLEAGEPAPSVRQEPGEPGQRAARPAGGQRPGAPRSVGEGQEQRASADRSGRSDNERSDSAVSRPEPPSGHDFSYSEGFAFPTGQKAKYKANVDAITLVKKLEAEGRLATPDEQAVLAKFTGWGGLPQAFQWSREWGKEYEELEQLLTDEEYKAARASTPNAHYTDPSTIRAMYRGLEHLGFKGGKVLEPGAGSGLFLGVMPGNLTAKSHRTAIELDLLSARIAKHLYQRANVINAEYQSVSFPNNFFDVAIGNVPFADIKIFDPNNKDLTKLRLSLHDYYFAKALSQVRPGGIVAFITSRYTMDKLNGKMRDYVASKADLLGAIRLPNTQFKAMANTDVTTDILVFQRREDGAPAGGEAWAKTEPLTINGQEIVVNEYFARHPEQIMGRLTTTGSMYGGQEVTVENDGREMSVALDEAFKRLPQHAMKPRKAPVSVTPRGMLEALEASDDVKEGGYTIQGNALYIRRGTQFVPVEDAGPTVVERAKGLLAVRDRVKEVLRTQLSGNDEAAIKKARQDLNKIYDKFVAKWGLMHEQGNRRLFRGDPDFPTLQALEKYDKATKTAKKTDIFRRRVIEFRPKAEKVETAKEAMLVAMNETGRVDIERMTELTGKKKEDLFRELSGIVFQNPEASTDWQPADLYLTGNVRQKLKAAQAAAAIDPRFQANVEALQAVQPTDVPAEQINVKLGHGWIPTTIYQDFFNHLFETNGSKVHYNANVGAYALNIPVGRGNTKNDSTWGTQRAPATEIIQDAIHSQMPSVYDTDRDGKRHLNEKETFAAREKLEKIQEEFRRWVWSDDARAKSLSRLYNDEFNAVRLREYDGSHLALPGANPLIKLRPHQKNGIWRALQAGNTLLNHVVGAGKTYTMIGIAMEARRLRVANKPMYVVPNHLTEYWGKSILQLYPAAKVLVPTKRDFEKENRQQLLSRIATGDWDGVVIAHSQLAKLQISLPAFKKFVDEQVTILADYIQEIQAEKGGGKAQKNIVKQLEKSKKRLEEKLKKREAAASANADQAITFEESGVDMLLVDEADLFKNLFFPTRMTRVAGLPNTESQRAYDLFLKTKYLNDMTGQRGVHFGTGTPISNSMAEAFTMQRYLQPKALEEAGLQHFDSWARQFGNVVVQMELAPDGSGYRPRSRFAEFVNVPELLQMFRQVMDVRLAEDLKLPVPKMKGGAPINNTSAPGEALQAYTQELIKRAANLKNVDPRQDNMLKITGDGRNAALDVRLRVPGAPEDKNGKVNKTIANVLSLYQRWTPVKGTQLVFLDLSTPKGEGKAKKKKGEVPEPVDEDADEIQEEVELEEEAALRGSVYQDIKRKLIKNGVPESEIAFIHDANTETRKEQLYGDVNAGRVRVLIGSTEKLGAGTNVQQRLVGLHSIDAPWRPRDIEQREGRILRQGNLLHDFSEFLAAGKPMKDLPEDLAEFAPQAALVKNFEVEVHRYATEAPSFDVYMWQTLESKAKAIAQIMRGDASTRTVQDIDTAVMSYAEMKAIASGNPMILERVKVDTELSKLSLLKSQFKSEQERMRYEMKVGIPASIEHAKESIAGEEKLRAIREKHPADPFAMELADVTYTEADDAAKALLTTFTDLITAPGDASFRTEIVGTYRGLLLEMTAYKFHKEFNLTLSTPGVKTFLRTTNMGPEVKSAGIVERLNNQLEGIDKRIEATNQDIAKKEKRQADLEKELQKPFEHEAKLAPLAARLKTIDGALDLTKKDQQQAIAMDDTAAPATEAPDRSPLGILKSERGSIPANPFARRQPEAPGFESSDADINARVKAAKKGLQKDGLSSRVKDSLAHVWRLISREFEHLPDTAQFSRLRNDLLKLAKYKGIAADEIQRELAAIVKPLTRQQYDQLEWKALLEDLKQEGLAERALPFGYTPEKVADDLENLNAAIERDPAVQAAWQRRQQLWARLKQDYKGSMDAIGFNVDKKLTKQNYFRHQVLEHARERHLKGTGAQVRTPTGRGFLKARAGSSMDINANYIQAEFEVMAQMVYDTQLAKVIAGVDQSLNIQKQLAAEAKTRNNEALQLIIDKGDERGRLADAALKDFRKRLGMHMSRIRKAMNLAKDERLSLPQIAAIAEDVENEAHLSARGVFKVINERKAFITDLLGPEKVSWQDLIPETHDLWQPREGNIFYMADSIPAQFAKALQESMLTEAGFPVDKLGKVLAMGAAREQYVIPTEAKATLDELSHKEHGWFVETNRHFVRHWKSLMLMAPRRVIRYVARNTTGDMDAMFVGNPAAFAKLPRAAKELLPVIFKDEPIGGEVNEWVKRGGYGTTMQFQELGQLNDLKAFRLTLDRASKGGVLGIPLKAWNGYWKSARMSVDYMETMRRYAAYLSYLEQMQENNGRPKNFGASKKETVMALPDIRDRAFKLSNELLGAYDRVSVAGQTIRDFWVLFYSWMEVNATRYGRLVGNALDGGHGGAVLGRGALITGKNAASFMIRLAFFWSMLQAWNYLLFDDDEEELRQSNPTVANRPHILFGRDEEGKIQYLAGVGALGDLLSWFGLDSFPGLVGDIMHDRLTVGQAIQNTAKAPVNKLWQGLNPMIKLAPELATRETSYPDVFHWRPIQDRAEHLGYQTTFGPEISALMDKPGKPLYDLEDLTGLLVQRTDPKSAAYFSWQTTERKHLEKMGKESSTIFWRTPRGEALHNWGLALAKKDANAEAVWKERYIELEKEKYGARFNEGKMYKDIEKSLRAKAPLSGMSKDDRDAVVQQLDEEEKATLRKAEDYYDEVIMQILPAARRSSMQRKLQSQGWLSKPTRPAPSSAGTESLTGLFP